MDAKALRRLIAIKKQLMDEFKLHFAKMNEDQKSSEKKIRKRLRFELPETCEKQKKNRKRLRLELPETLSQTDVCEKRKKNRKELQLELPETAPAPPPTPATDKEQEIRQQRTWPVHLLENNVNNYPAAFVDVGALTPGYSFNSS